MNGNIQRDVECRADVTGLTFVYDLELGGPCKTIRSPCYPCLVRENEFKFILERGDHYISHVWLDAQKP